jgi:hypothetical protein
MAKYGLAEAEWDEIKAEVRGILIGLARVEQTIYYSDLAIAISTAHMHHRAPAFAQILQDLCADEVAAGRPILGVLVVNKQTERCGAGFFKWCAAQGFDVSDPEAFWQREYERIVDYWGE